ncbi:thiol-disulfide oxidoreductase DCC family protein [Marinobacter sp. 1Y8]
MKTNSELSDIPAGKQVILFDGVCAFCNFWSRFVMRYDRQHRFALCHIQSATGERIFRHFGLSTEELDSVVLVDGDHAFRRSDAVLGILAALPAPWCWFSVLKRIPRRLRDAVYDAVGKRRYRWFGRYDQCPIPSAEDRGRFLNP